MEQDPSGVVQVLERAQAHPCDWRHAALSLSGRRAVCPRFAPPGAEEDDGALEDPAVLALVPAHVRGGRLVGRIIRGLRGHVNDSEGADGNCRWDVADGRAELVPVRGRILRSVSEDVMGGGSDGGVRKESERERRRSCFVLC